MGTTRLIITWWPHVCFELHRLTQYLDLLALVDIWYIWDENLSSCLTDYELSGLCIDMAGAPSICMLLPSDCCYCCWPNN